MVIIATLVIIFSIWVLKRYFYDLILKPCWNGLKSKPSKVKELSKGNVASSWLHILIINFIIDDNHNEKRLTDVDISDLS